MDTVLEAIMDTVMASTLTIIGTTRMTIGMTTNSTTNQPTVLIAASPSVLTLYLTNGMKCFAVCTACTRVKVLTIKSIWNMKNNYYQKWETVMIKSKQGMAQPVDYADCFIDGKSFTDIDAVMEYGDAAYIIVEVKRAGYKMSYAQRLALDRLARDLGTLKPTILMLVEHEVLIGSSIPLVDSRVRWYQVHSPVAGQSTGRLWESSTRQGHPTIPNCGPMSMTCRPRGNVAPGTPLSGSALPTGPPGTVSWHPSRGISKSRWKQ